MTYSPGHDSASAVTRFFAASRVCAASTKRGLPPPRNLRMQKGRPNQTPKRTIYKGAVDALSHESGELGVGYATLDDIRAPLFFQWTPLNNSRGFTFNARAILPTLRVGWIRPSSILRSG
jgi:hypothetical protein